MHIDKPKIYPAPGAIMLFALLVLMLCSSCTPAPTALIHGKLRAIKPSEPRNMLYAGAAKVDITPPPGFPMGGHSFIGQISRGQWLRLKARSLYIEAPNGSKLALISTDLWSMPAGLADRVTDIVANSANESCRLERRQMIFSATHTHQSPGNFSSSPLYNQFGGPEKGFDRNLFDFLANQLADVVLASCNTAESAKLYFGDAQVEKLVRNRSIEAFLQNEKSQVSEILEGSNSLPTDSLPPIYSPNPISAYHAVDPMLQTLWIKSTKEPSHVIGIGAFFAVHPTTLSHEAAIYSSDMFGVAATVAEQKLGLISGGSAPVVAIFNGAEGDVSAAWISQTRNETLRLGKKLGDAILNTENKSIQINADIKVRFSREQLAGAKVGKDKFTEKKLTGGPGALAGAEDGPTKTRDNFIGCHEGAPDPLCRVVFWAAKYYMRCFSPPTEAPLGVYTLGPIVLATLPGEFTTMMGRRIRNELASQLKVSKEKVILLGLSNEYVSYFTTPEEYKAGQYEGGSTLYGGLAGVLVGKRLKTLAEQFSEKPPASNDEPYKYHYDAGEVQTFSTVSKDFKSMEKDALKTHIVKTMFTNGEKPQMYDACWDGPAPTIAEAKAHDLTMTPSVQVEKKQPDGRWQPLTVGEILENDQGTNFIIQLSMWKKKQSKWCAFWLPSADLNETSPLRFKIIAHDGVAHTSAEFFSGQNN